jgi:septum formation inhibitor MinC
MIDLSLSLNEENFITDTSRDAEFTRKLFGDLNHDILGQPGDGMVIILDDSDEEKEAPDEKTVGTKLTATSAAVNPAPTASTAVDDAPEGAKMIIVIIKGPIRSPVVATAMEVETVRLRPPRRIQRC